MAQQMFGKWSECVREYTNSDLETILGHGEQAMAKLIQAIGERGLPPGAVVEIEFAVRRREPAFA